LWLTETARCFITEADVSGINVFDNETPHLNNEDFLIHNHRYDLSSIPIEGHQENVLFEEIESPPIEDLDSNVGLYKKFKFHSAILNSGNKMSHEFVKKVWLNRIQFKINEQWFMKTDEIHRICWKGPIIALLIEHRDPSFVNPEPTNAYLVDTAKELPCDESQLYKAISQVEFDRLVSRLKIQMDKYCRELKASL